MGKMGGGGMRIETSEGQEGPRAAKRGKDGSRGAANSGQGEPKGTQEAPK